MRLLHNHLTRVIKAPGLCDACDRYHKKHSHLGWLRSEYLAAMRWTGEAYEDTVRRSWKDRDNPESLTKKGTRRKQWQNWIRGDIEMLRFNRGSYKAFEEGGWESLHEFQNNFEWRYNR